MVNSNELSNKPILYELLEYFIRKQEPELIVSLYLFIQFIYSKKEKKETHIKHILNTYL